MNDPSSTAAHNGLSALNVFSKTLLHLNMNRVKKVRHVKKVTVGNWKGNILATGGVFLLVLFLIHIYLDKSVLLLVLSLLRYNLLTRLMLRLKDKRGIISCEKQSAWRPCFSTFQPGRPPQSHLETPPRQKDWYKGLLIWGPDFSRLIWCYVGKRTQCWKHTDALGLCCVQYRGFISTHQAPMTKSTSSFCTLGACAESE